LRFRKKNVYLLQDIFEFTNWLGYSMKLHPRRLYRQTPVEKTIATEEFQVPQAKAQEHTEACLQQVSENILSFLALETPHRGVSTGIQYLEELQQQYLEELQQLSNLRCHRQKP